MHDNHRPKQDLINEVVGLRKQVADLKEAAVQRWRVEQAVRRSEEQYRELVELAPGGLCRLDSDGAVAHANATLSELLGFPSRTELLDFAREFGLFEDDGERRQLLEALRVNTQIRDFPATLRRAGGGTVRARLHGRALRAKDDSLDGFIILVTAEQEETAERSQS